MSQQDAFLSAIREAPDDDTPRLAYADWLEEHGDPDRAAFIRVQCRLAEMSPGDPDWVDLIEQQHELVAAQTLRLLRSVPEQPDRFAASGIIDDHEEPFRRGFPYFIACQTSDDEWSTKEVDGAADELTNLV